jgi:hypothetical protein
VEQGQTARSVEAVVDAVGVQQAGQVRSRFGDRVAVLESGRADQRCDLADDAVGGVDPRSLVSTPAALCTRAVKSASG